MRGITISDIEGHLLAVDLIDILKVLGEEAEGSEWRLSRVEAVGPVANELQALSGEGGRLSGSKLVQLAGQVKQIVNGEFEGYRPGEPERWIIIKAEDSFAYTVETGQDDVFTRLKARFNDVEEWSY